MSWNVIIGAGVGIGLYAVGSMIRSASRRKKRTRQEEAVTVKPRIEPAKPFTRKIVRKPDSVPMPVSEKSSLEPAPTVARSEKSQKPTAPPKTQLRVVSAASKGKKQWFLVKTKSGQVRVCEAWEKTPKTVAGPFPTKAAALKAKES